MAAVSPLAGTVDELRGPHSTWGHEIRSYEREKRRIVDEGLVRGQQLRLPKGAVQVQERVFDPVLQKFREPGLEKKQKRLEEKERIAHLNRAQDIDIVRTQPFNIINQSSRLEGLAPGEDPMRLKLNAKNAICKISHPTSYTDFNIVSNLAHDVHHWQKPDERPRAEEREPQRRKVPHWSVKDFDVVTNRYMVDHDVKIQREKRLKLLEKTHQHNQQNVFDPVSQQFNDPKAEERAKAAMDAREVEMTMRADAQMPPSYRGRVSNHYGILSHEAHRPDMLQMWDTMENERKERHKNRYIVEHNYHVQDIKHDHIVGSRKLNRIAPERFEGPKERGYHIIENKSFGKLPTEKRLYEDFTTKRLTPWERVQQGRLENNPEMVQTIKLPAEAEASKPRSVRSSGSQPTLRATGSDKTRWPHKADGQSECSRRSSVRRSQSESGLSAARSQRSQASAAAVQTIRPPPAPSIPGDDRGSVRSQQM